MRTANAGCQAPKAIGYIRVSTSRQAENGYGLDAQREQIEQFCAGNGLELVALISDVMSGRRPISCTDASPLCAIQAGIANVLVVNTLTAQPQHGRWREAGRRRQAEGWRIVGLDGTDSNTVSQLTAHARLLVAEEERELISKRTKQGLIKARQAGKQLGKPSTIDRDVVARIVQLRSGRYGNQGYRQGAGRRAHRRTA